MPEEWTADQLLENLRNHDKPLVAMKPYRISLYPAYSGRTQTALLNTDAPHGLFQNLNPDQTHPIAIRWTSGTGEEIDVHLTVDCHFYGLTPLNTPVGDNIIE